MAIGFGVACPKPESRKTAKGRKTRAEAQTKRQVRAMCVERDGYCALLHLRGFRDRGQMEAMSGDGYCDGPSEWAHMHDRRRSKTRGMAPEDRHDTKHSLILCRAHHAAYDRKELIITALSRNGADGPLKFRRAK